MQKISTAFEQAEREALLPGGDWVYLKCTPAAGSASWQSKILKARLGLGSAGADQRGKGSQGLKVWIERVNWWERDTPQAVYLEHAQGNNGGAGNLLVYNHSDTGHSNVANIPAEHLVGGEFVPYIEGDLPAPVDMTISIVGGGTEPATFIVGEIIRQECDSLTLVYTGEGGIERGTATGAITVSASCAGDQYMLVSWNGSGDQEIFRFASVLGADLQKLCGYPVRLVMRLADSISTAATEKFLYRFKVLSMRDGVEALLYESPNQYMEQGSELIMGPVLYLPPWLIPAGSLGMSNLQLVLALSAGGTGAHTLKIDSMQLVGLDGWRNYYPLTDEISGGIHDDFRREMLLAPGEWYQSHISEGPGLMLYPGRDHRFWFFTCGMMQGKSR